MSDKEAETLSQYIELVLRNNEIDAAKTAETGNPETGRNLYYEKFVCQACHSIDGQGGYYGPALENTANRLKGVWIDRRLIDAHPYEPEAREPSLAIPDGDRVDITAFLNTLKKEAAP
jgi:cytochrome c